MVWTRLHISQQVNQKSRGYVSYVPAIDLILWYIYQCRAQVLFFTKEIWSFTCQRDLSIQETKGRKWHLVFYSIRSFHNLNHFLCLEKNATHCTSVSTPRRCWYRAIHNIPSWDTKHLIMLAKLELENEQQLGWNILFLGLNVILDSDDLQVNTNISHPSKNMIGSIFNLVSQL